MENVLGPNRTSEFKEFFDICKNGNGRVSVKRLHKIRSDMGFTETLEKLTTRVTALVSLDAAANGIMFQDFLHFVTDKIPQDLSYEEELAIVFSQLDLNSDGALDKGEVLQGMMKHRPQGYQNDEIRRND
jgi:Ca2+-binding EF-hand superfamily protein